MPVFSAFRGGYQSYLDRKGESMNNKHTGFFLYKLKWVDFGGAQSYVLLTPAHLEFFSFQPVSILLRGMGLFRLSDPEMPWYRISCGLYLWSSVIPMCWMRPLLSADCQALLPFLHESGWLHISHEAAGFPIFLAITSSKSHHPLLNFSNHLSEQTSLMLNLEVD